ncbi:MAG: TIGR02266 family protein, partial [Polyangiaceae bacterium]
MTQDTRKDRRVKIVSLNVRYKSATVDEFIENHAHDVSRGGIYIKTANPFPAGTLLKFEIRLASDQAVIAGVGRVVWKRDAANGQNERPAGMGVKFIKIDPPSAAVIDKLVNTRSDAGKSFEAEAEDAPPPVLQAPAAAAAAVANMPVRKATMMGMGLTSPVAGVPAPAPAASSHAGGPATHSSTPPRPTPSHAPKPTAAAAAVSAPLFPKTNPEAEAPPAQEQTVMKQAAELLEEALREAGGSMEDVGTNPLFAGAAAARAPAEASPAAGAADGAPVDEAARARALAGGLTPAPIPAEAKKGPSEPPPRTTRDAPIAKERPRTPSRPPSRPPYARVSSPPPKKSSGGIVVILIGFAAVAGAVVMYKDKIFGSPASEAQPATPAATASAPPTPSAAASAAA